MSNSRNPLEAYAEDGSATGDMAARAQPDVVIPTGVHASDVGASLNGTRPTDSTEAIQIKWLQRKKDETNFVFLFGAAQRGKTVVTSSIVNFLSETVSQGQVRAFALSNNPKTDEGIALFKRIIRAHTEQRFPERSVLSPNGEPIYVTFRFSPDRELDAPELPLTFLEMPGDTLALIDSPDGEGSLPASIDAFLKVDGLRPAFILVTSQNTAHTDDQLMSSFIDYVSALSPKLGASRFLLLVAQWDTYDGQLSPAEFVKSNMRLTFSKLYNSRHSIAPFSIGDVSEVGGKPFLQRFESSYAKAVVNWLYMEFKGKPLYRRSLWRKILDALKRFS